MIGGKKDEKSCFYNAFADFVSRIKHEKHQRPGN